MPQKTVSKRNCQATVPVLKATATTRRAHGSERQTALGKRNVAMTIPTITTTCCCLLLPLSPGDVTSPHFTGYVLLFLKYLIMSSSCP